MRLHRLIGILLIVESRKQIKAKDLAQALDTSVRTIYRDIDTLCEAGIPLAASTGPNGGIYLMDGYNVNMKGLYGEEVLSLYLSGIGIRPENHSDTELILQNTLLKLEKSLPTEYSKDVKKARKRFYFDDTPWWGERSKIPFLETIRKSVWQLQMLKIIYGRSINDFSERIVCPYGLVVKSMEWYFVAYCKKSSSIKTFKCDRIYNVEVLDETFQIPNNFNLEEYWKKSKMDFTKSRSQIEKYPVTIKLPKFSSDILKNLEVYETLYREDYICATINMHKYEYACMEVMDIIGKVEILEPYELRNFVVKKLKEIIADYSK